MSVSDVCSCRAITPGAPLNAQRKATLIGSPPGRCTSATRCVLVPLVRLPSPVTQTFCTAPASGELGGRLFAYTGMFAPLLTQLRSPVPGPRAHAGHNAMLRRDYWRPDDLSWTGRLPGNRC